MAAYCKNCGTCTCTGTQLMTAKDGTECCSICIKQVNENIQYTLVNNPGMSVWDLKRYNKNKKR